MKNLNVILESLFEKQKIKVFAENHSSVHGGDINSAYKLSTNHGEFFVKENDGTRFPKMFMKESNGLKTLTQSPFKVPQVILEKENFLVLEWLEKEREEPIEYWRKRGTSLAELHQITNENFGFSEDNYIGSLPQINTRKENWSAFFIENRLEYQVKLGLDDGRISKDLVMKFEKLYYKFENLFPIEKPSLLHGDLWSGNVMNVIGNTPAIFDPAVYFGHREMDLAMTKLFGGFHRGMYEAYQVSNPLEVGFEERVGLCNLYPLMVHVNLFGGAYEVQVNQILNRLV